ncbi:hypothetical protein GHJ82_19810 [Sinorhizobium saheli]|nr:hypothetical protein [Sinorhizobium saheli]
MTGAGASLSFPYAVAEAFQSIFDAPRLHHPDDRHIRRMHMSDLLFLAIGVGSFAVFALYARALGRL